MTTQKKLKQTVRARMDKTGERYAAARRAIVATGPAQGPGTDRPAGVLPGYDRHGGSTPVVSALTNALVAAGVRTPAGDPWSEALVFGLGGGVGGGYFLFQYGGTPTVAIIGTRARWQDPAGLVEGVLERVGTEHRIHVASGRRPADAALDAALAAGHPSIAWVDRATLPHGGLPAEFVKYEIRVAGVSGRSDAGSTILVDDRARRPLPVPASTFSDARGAIGSVKRRLVEIAGPGRDVDVADAVKTAIAAGHRERMDPKIRNFGLPALAKWADQLSDPKDAKAWPRTMVRSIDLVRALRLAFATIDGGAGGAGERDLQADFLEEAAALTDRAALREAAARYRALAADWRDLAEALLPDAIEPLGRIKALERRRWAAFDRSAGPDLETFLTISRDLEADEAAVMRWCTETGSADGGPAGPEIAEADRMDLLADLAARVRAIHGAEVEASEASVGSLT